jgi:CheY-like chemotaxis protein
MNELEFVSLNDRPALVALSDPEWIDAAKTLLSEIGYKVHAASNHDDFIVRFGRIQYQVVIIDENFCAAVPEENLALRYLQQLPMAQRRHCVFILLGDSFSTLNTLQAFQQSVHAVINRDEMKMLGPSVLGPIIQRVVADNDLFLHVYRDTQMQIAQSGG